MGHDNQGHKYVRQEALRSRLDGERILVETALTTQRRRTSGCSGLAMSGLLC